MRNVYRTDDPDRDFAAWDMDRERWLENRPACEECGEPIQEEYGYRLGGRLYCERCVVTNREYIEEEV